MFWKELSCSILFKKVAPHFQIFTVLVTADAPQIFALSYPSSSSNFAMVSIVISLRKHRGEIHYGASIRQPTENFVCCFAENTKNINHSPHPAAIMTSKKIVTNVFFAVLITAMLLSVAFAMTDCDAADKTMNYDEPDHIDVATDEGYENICPSTAEWIIGSTTATLKLNGVNVKKINVVSDRELTIELNGENVINATTELISMYVAADTVTITGESLTINLPDITEPFGLTIYHYSTGSKCTIDNAKITIRSDKTSASEIDALGMYVTSHSLEINDSAIYFSNVKYGVYDEAELPVSITDSYIGLDNPTLQEWSVMFDLYVLVKSGGTVEMDSEPVCGRDGEIKYYDSSYEEVGWDGDFCWVCTSSSASIGTDPTSGGHSSSVLPIIAFAIAALLLIAICAKCKKN